MNKMKIKKLSLVLIFTFGIIFCANSTNNWIKKKDNNNWITKKENKSWITKKENKSWITKKKNKNYYLVFLFLLPFGIVIFNLNKKM